jgi:2-methylaconitate cis-trans-isomerase PrpF
MKAVFWHFGQLNRRTRLSSGSDIVVMKVIGSPQATQIGGGGGFSRSCGPTGILIDYRGLVTTP